MNDRRDHEPPEEDYGTVHDAGYSEHDSGAFGDAGAQEDWEDQPAVADGDFQDPHAVEAEEVEEEPQPAARKSRGGWFLPVFLAVLLAGAGGFAYWQFGMNGGSSAGSSSEGETPRIAVADATPTVDQLPVKPNPALPTPPSPEQISGTAPEPLAPPPSPPPSLDAAAAFAPVATATMPVSEAPPAVTPPAEMPPPPAAEAKPVMQLPTATAPATVVGAASAPEAPAPNVAMAPLPPVPAMQASPVVAAATAPEPKTFPTPVIMPAATDKADKIALTAAEAQLGEAEKKLSASADEKMALEKQLDALKQTVKSLNDKIAQLQAAAKPDKVAETGIVLNKQAAAPAKKKTASVKPAKKTQPAKKPAVAEPSNTATANWELRAATPGKAWIANTADESDLRQVKVGDTVPGLGKIKSIANRNGAWAVTGSKGKVE